MRFARNHQHLAEPSDDKWSTAFHSGALQEAKMDENGKERPLVVFHHPGSVAPNGRTGSQVRPWQLLQAFREEGYDVMPVVGHGAERREQIKMVLKALRTGQHISAVYSEARSIPTLLTEKHRLPVFPTMDFRFLRGMRQTGVPVGLFYRDIRWRFKMYQTMLPWPGRAVTIPLYWYDWWWYRHAVDHLFLPSHGMAAHLPTTWPADRVSALPPGTSLPDIGGISKGPRKPVPLRFLYVGGVRPPNYDLTPLLSAMRGLPGVELALCCRAGEWEEIRPQYAGLMNGRIDVIHHAGDELRGLYERADVFALLWQPHEYLDFAVPVKLFEAVGYGLPILTLAGTEAARIVEKYNLGWVVGDAESIRPLVERLQAKPSLLIEKRAAVSRVREQHTWGARVREILSTLGRYDRRNL